MDVQLDRRDFIKNLGLAGSAAWVSGKPVFADDQSPNERLNVGVIGVGGSKGHTNLAGVSQLANIAALCDMDDGPLGKAAEKHPRAKKYKDFRKMLEQKDLDAIVVSTADHTHAVIGVMAMRMGKHIYCEKPLAHTLHETRVMARTAAETSVATQMGNQCHSSNALRRVAEIIQSGAIGPVREVWCWSHKRKSGRDLPTTYPPVPKGVDWDLWLGPAAERPYHSTYHPYNWRGWWAFGEGNVGDMGCHIIDPAFLALGLRYPTSIEMEGPPVHPESTPEWIIGRYEFPAADGGPPIKFTWFDGGTRPQKEIEGVKFPDQGVLFFGADGRKLMHEHQHSEGAIHLFPKKQFADFKPPAPTYSRPEEADVPPPSVHNSSSIYHMNEWVEACKSGGSTGSNFDYGGAETEMLLAGIVSYRLGKKLDWDGAKMAATNASEAQDLVHYEYRKGWEL